jgi:hypothetical protein
MHALLQRDKETGQLVRERRRLLQYEKSHSPGAFCSDTRHFAKQRCKFFEGIGKRHGKTCAL